VAQAFRLPELGEGLAECEVCRWLVTEGRRVARDEPLVEVQTDKATMEIASPADGVVLKIVAGEGEVVPVGGVLAVIGEEGEQLLYALGPPPAESSAERPVVEVVPDAPIALGRAPREEGPQDERSVPIRGIRRAIVEQVTRAHREVPAVTFVEECDFGALGRPDVLAHAVHAAARALRRHPELNARIDGDELVLLERIDVGVAVQTDEGLVVPVIRDCADRTVAEVSAELERLAAGARAGTLAAEELRGSTFTVTEGGELGGILFTPLVNHPEVAILALHRIAERPVVRDGRVVVRPIGNVSVTFDHRVVDGAGAAAFCLDVIDRLQGRI
jgi:pyruvate/2-oxoglutarate dehydrogenase complex dihydrolipoamide acyltransferase (E2) component